MEKLELIEYKDGRIDLIGMPNAIEVKDKSFPYFSTEFEMGGHFITFRFKLNYNHENYFDVEEKHFPSNSYLYEINTDVSAAHLTIAKKRNNITLLDYEVLKKAVELYNKYVEETNHNMISLRVNCTFEIALEDENIVNMFKDNHPIIHQKEYSDIIKEAVSKQLGIDFDKIKVSDETGLQSISSKYRACIINYSTR